MAEEPQPPGTNNFFLMTILLEQIFFISIYEKEREEVGIILSVKFSFIRSFFDFLFGLFIQQSEEMWDFIQKPLYATLFCSNAM